MKRALGVCLLGLLSLYCTPAAAKWGTPRSPAIPGAGGYVLIPKAAVQPAPGATYKAIFDASRFADAGNQVTPAIAAAATQLNALEPQKGTGDHTEKSRRDKVAPIDQRVPEAERTQVGIGEPAASQDHD